MRTRSRARAQKSHHDRTSEPSRAKAQGNSRLQASFGNVKLKEQRTRKSGGLRKGPRFPPWVRHAEVEKVLLDDYGHCDASPNDLRILLHCKAKCHPFEERVPALLEEITTWAPHKPRDEAQRLAEEIAVNPMIWRAGTLGRLLRVTAEQRRRLGLKTIRAYDQTKKEQDAERRENDRLGAQKRRRKKGIPTRAAYNAKRRATAAARQREWERLGMSRSTYYRWSKKSGAACETEIRCVADKPESSMNDAPNLTNKSVVGQSMVSKPEPITADVPTASQRAAEGKDLSGFWVPFDGTLDLPGYLITSMRSRPAVLHPKGAAGRWTWLSGRPMGMARQAGSQPEREQEPTDRLAA